MKNYLTLLPAFAAATLGGFSLNAADAVELKIDVSREVANVPRTLYGTGMEDVNHEIYGGLDAQRLYDESFEQQEIAPTFGLGLPPSADFVCGRQWDAVTTGDGAVVADRREPHLGQVSVSLAPGSGSASVVNAGLNRWGVPCRAGRAMKGWFYVRGEVGALAVSLRRRDGGAEYARTAVALAKTNGWQKVEFALVPDATDPAAAFAITATGGGKVWIDDAYLADEPTNAFGRLGCREDIVDGFRKLGVTFLRWGGSMADTTGYTLKSLGPGDRRPTTGYWFATSSTGFRHYEFVQMAELMKLPCAFSIYAYEPVPRAVALAEWLRQFKTDVYVQIGNEECLQYSGPIYDSFSIGDCRRYCASLRVLVTEMRRVNPRLKFVSAMMFNRDKQDVMDEAFRLTDGYVDYWDLHPWVQVVETKHVPDVADNIRADFAAFRSMVARLNPQSKIKPAIFEENGSECGLRRALIHAAVLTACREQGDYLLTSCPANALQPYGQNQNGWNQGNVFFTPDRVWLQACGWAQQMAAANHRDVLVAGTSSARDVLLSATRDRAGKSVVLHLVNASDEARPVTLAFADGKARPLVRATTLTGDDPLAANTPEDLERVVPRDVTDAFRASATLPPRSYTVLEY